MRKLICAMIFILLLFSFVFAEEGMWPLDQLNNLDWKAIKAMGLELSPAEIYNPNARDVSDAVVQLGGGTGTFVSAKGLMLTNHHVAYGAIQRQSSAESDFIRNGFLAETYSAEVPAKGYRARICIGMKDVTDEVLKGISDEMSYFERNETMEKNQQKISEAAETEDFIQANVVNFLSGTKYYLYTYFVIKDVRLVYAPPRSIGEYGGDIDNWMWPRHTGDFSFMRAHVGPDGNPADYSEDNVPYKPKKFLPLSIKGIKQGDFTMVLGYPGNTMRYRSSYSMSLWQNSTYPEQVDLFKTNIKALEELAGENRDLQIKYASKIKGLNNALKYTEGMLEGLKKSNILERKRQQEAEFKKFLIQNPALDKEYGYVLPEIEKVYAELNTYYKKQNMIGYLFGSSQLLNGANLIYRWSLEKEKKMEDREPGFSDRDMKRIKKNLAQQRDLMDVPSDKKILAIWINKAADLPADQKIEAVEKIALGKTGNEHSMLVQAFVEDMFSKTVFTDFDRALELFDKSKQDIDNLNDPLIQFAAALEKENKVIQEKYNAFVGAVFKLRPPLIQGMAEWKKGKLYPDANGTIRFTYGEIAGYSPADAVVYKCFTTLAGVVEKDTGEEPFDNPKALNELYMKKDFGKYADPALKDVPVNFLHRVDSSGGNSGSSVLNNRGEIIGLLFDGNYESMTSDFQYNYELTRSISVDVRYVLFITDKFGNAQNVLKELTIIK